MLFHVKVHSLTHSVTQSINQSSIHPSIYPSIHPLTRWWALAYSKCFLGFLFVLCWSYLPNFWNLFGQEYITVDATFQIERWHKKTYNITLVWFCLYLFWFWLCGGNQAFSKCIFTHGQTCFSLRNPLKTCMENERLIVELFTGNVIEFNFTFKKSTFIWSHSFYSSRKFFVHFAGNKSDQVTQELQVVWIQKTAGWPVWRVHLWWQDLSFAAKVARKDFLC